MTADLLGVVVAALRDQVYTALAATPAGAPGRVCEVAGDLAWDACDCGLLSVTVDRMFPSTVFPQEASGRALAAVCAPPYLVAALTITVLRCAPGPDRFGVGPTCAALDAAAQVWFADADATRQAVACAAATLTDSDAIDGFTLGVQTPVGPEGGCVGSQIRLTVALANCPCPVG